LRPSAKVLGAECYKKRLEGDFELVFGSVWMVKKCKKHILTTVLLHSSASCDSARTHLGLRSEEESSESYLSYKTYD